MTTFATEPVLTVDASPDGHALDAGTPADPTDAEAFIAAPIGGRLAGLLVDSSGEVGLSVRRGGAEGPLLVPARKGTEWGYVFRSTWPPVWPVGRSVREGETVVVGFRNRGDELDPVDAAAAFVER